MQRLPTIFSFALLAVPANARETLTPANLFDLVSVVEVALAPDGKHAAYSVHVPRPFADGAGEDYRELHVYDLVAGQSRPFVREQRQVFSLGWTPDGKAITFRAVMPGTQGMQVHAIDLRGGEAYPLTRHPAHVQQRLARQGAARRTAQAGLPGPGWEGDPGGAGPPTRLQA